MDDELRTFYYFWKYARLTPSELYKKKKSDIGEYRMMKAFLFKEIEDRLDEKKYQLCPFMVGERG